MARTLNQIIVVDIEATCWDGAPPAGQERDIIEIGICPLEVASLSRKERRSIIVRPQRSTVSPFCTTLTTLTQGQVDAGVSFAEACRVLMEDYQTKDRVWASYGEFDRLQFAAQCRDTGVPYPFGERHLNVKTLFALMHGQTREIGMARALADLDVALDGTHHRGADDAWNIAGILAVLLGRGRTR